MDKKIVIITAFFIYFISGYFAYAYFVPQGKFSLRDKIGFPSMQSVKYKPPADTSGQEETEFAGPLTQPCPLNGEYLTKGHEALWKKRRPLGVMIENHLDSRPQSGLSSADIVYEAVAEGGITRFLAIFYCKDAKYLGPVRSARIYFIELIQGYGNYPLYAHVGGANTPGPADALGQINRLGWAGYNDLNQFSVAFPTFYRDYERNKGVMTEHTMYSSTARLWKYAAEKRKLSQVDEDNVSWSSNFKSWEFKDDSPAKEYTKVIKFDFWEGKDDYSVKWTYDPSANNYRRSHGDSQAHIDKNTGKQIKAKNIIIMFSRQAYANDGYPDGHMLYQTTGQGKTIIFNDGQAIKGSWQRPKKTDQVRFYDEKGQQIKLNRGQTWIELVPQDNTIKY